MNEYFSPCRRKIGVMTLVMACFSMLAWLRSSQVEDYFNVLAGRRSSGRNNYCHLYSTVSANGTLYLGRIWFQSEDPKEVDEFQSYFHYPRWSTSHEVEFPSDPELRYIWQFAGFGTYERSPDDPNNGGWRVFIPYWAIVIPLAILSAWTLVSRPNGTKPQYALQPPHHTGA